MEVLANGFKANFWIPIEEEPDIDRFVDEQILIDMDRFMLVGTLEKVSTCKKKNEEKEFEYFKQITVQVCNICSAADNNINIQIPDKKEDFLYDVKFRYAPEPEQVEGDGMEEVNDTPDAAPTEEEELLDGMAAVGAETAQEMLNEGDAEEPLAVNLVAAQEPVEELDFEATADRETEPDDEFDDSMFEDEPVTDAKMDMTPGTMHDGMTEPDNKPDNVSDNEDDDGIDWGE